VRVVLCGSPKEKKMGLVGGVREGGEEVLLRLGCRLRREWELRRMRGLERVWVFVLKRILRLASGWMALEICEVLRRPLCVMVVFSMSKLDFEVDGFRTLANLSGT